MQFFPAGVVTSHALQREEWRPRLSHFTDEQKYFPIQQNGLGYFHRVGIFSYLIWTLSPKTFLFFQKLGGIKNLDYIKKFQVGALVLFKGFFIHSFIRIVIFLKYELREVWTTES